MNFAEKAHTRKRKHMYIHVLQPVYTCLNRMSRYFE